MARLWSSGAELNSAVADVEITARSVSTAVSSAQPRSQTYSYITEPTTSNHTIRYSFKSSATADAFFLRAYIYITDAPGVACRILGFSDSVSATINHIGIRMNTNRTLELWNEEDGTQIGSDSSALSLNTWYRLEIKADMTTIASSAIEAKIDGTSFASGTVNLANGAMQICWGFDAPAGNPATATAYFDDIAINDDSGSFQNSYPGEGEIIHLIPNGNGEVTTGWNFGTAPSYTVIDEVTPGTDYITENGEGEIWEVTLTDTPAGLESTDTINCVAVGVRADANATGSAAEIVLRIKSVAGGTLEESASIATPNTTDFTNSSTAPRNYPFVLYDLPGASTTAWTKSDLDTTQIGVRCAVHSNGEEGKVNTLWLSVDHTAASSTNVTVNAGVLSLTSSLPAPTITPVRNVSVSAGVLTTTSSTQAPSISIHESNTFGVLSLASSQPAPTITAIRIVTVSSGVLSATSSLPAPTVTPIRNVSVSAGVLSLTSSQPTPSVGLSSSISAGVISLASSIPSISVSVGDGATPQVLSLTSSLPAPTITTTRNVTVTPNAISLTSVQPAPAVQISESLAQGVLSLSASQPTPTVLPIRNVSISAGVLSLTSSVQAPSVLPVRNLNHSASALVLASSLPSIGISVGDGATVSAQTITATLPTPTITTIRNLSVSLSAQSLTGSTPAPSVQISDTLSQNVQALVISQPTPTVSAIRNVTVSAGVLALTASLPSASVSVTESNTLGVQTLTITLPTPSVSGTINGTNYTFYAPVLQLGPQKIIFGTDGQLYYRINPKLYTRI